jgi:hypothetical protein
MADLATPSAAQIGTSGAAKTAGKGTPVVKPEKPDEEAYKSELAKAEKDLKAAEERMVCRERASHTCSGSSIRTDR